MNDETGMSPENFMAFADNWLLSQDIITDVTHNNIILNLYRQFPAAKYIEYFMELETKTIEVHIHLGWYGWYFKSKDKLKKDCQALIKQYLKDFQVVTEVHRHVST